MRDPTKMAAAFERGTHVFTVHRGGLPADITHGGDDLPAVCPAGRV